MNQIHYKLQVAESCKCAPGRFLRFRNVINDYMLWKIIDSGKKSATDNMLLDAELLHSLSNEPILHLYDWEKESATYGHFIQPTHFFKMHAVKTVDLDLARRPTGGGIVFHSADYAFSVLVPASYKQFSHNPLENYLYINRLVGCVLEEFLGHSVDLLPIDNPLEKADFCMAKPTKYDLMLKGKKVGGAAQRKTRKGYLHQGSIFLGHVSSKLLSEVLNDCSIIDVMKLKSAPLLDTQGASQELLSARNRLKHCFIKVFKKNSCTTF